MKKVVHLTSAHPRFDIRIFVKMCSSLAKNGYDVSLVVADGKGFEENNNVKIYDVGKPLGRMQRMIKSSALVYKRALRLNADIYHIHDPELLPYALLLKLKRKKVIFDSHEDVPRQILAKPYLNDILLNVVSKTFEFVENQICKRLDGIVAATPFIRDIFLKVNSNSIDVNNFPIPGELDSKVVDKNFKKQICYVGGITPVRGCNENVKAMEFVKNDVTLALAGNFDSGADVDKLKQENGWKRVKTLGFLDRKGVKIVLEESFAGLVTLHPIINYIDALPIKMFEYMLAGIPPIASNFPLWKEIIEGNNCGICVNPLKPEEIAKAIDYLYEHPEEAKLMGENGKKAVYEKYNWNIEEKKLLKIYKMFLREI